MIVMLNIGAVFVINLVAAILAISKPRTMVSTATINTPTGSERGCPKGCCLSADLLPTLTLINNTIELIMSVNELIASDMIAMLLEIKPIVSFAMNRNILPIMPTLTAFFLEFSIVFQSVLT